jgi:hypothetical protein
MCIKHVSLPIHIDQVLVVANDLHIDGLQHFAIPVVLFHSPCWNLMRFAIKNHQYQMQTEAS